jgi:AAA15 family ATPase/GTPase
MSPTEEPEQFYTKAEVDKLIAAAVAEARAIDEESMRQHNIKATIISMILGLICLALFVDGLLRILGIIPPFMDLDVNVIDDVIEKVENDMMPLIEPYVKKGLQIIPGR